MSAVEPITGANEKLGLPRDKMRKVSIAFDVDGTLRCNCTDVCQDPNPDIVFIFNILSRFKNTDMYVWSGGGADYAMGFADRYGLNVKARNCISKIGAPKIDIAVDDIQDTDMGVFNLIVKMK